MTTAQQLEKQWISAFSQSNLVDGNTKQFNPLIAHQLFYGKQHAEYPAEYPDHFLELYQELEEREQADAVQQLLVFLAFAGINIPADTIQIFIEKYPHQYKHIFKRAYYILKTLAHRDTNLDINQPFTENRDDIYYLINLVLADAPKELQLELFEDVDLPTLYNRYVNIPEGYDQDPVIKDLFNSLEQSNTSFFITGKAGTGKSTFLHYFAQHSKKTVLMTAFTGIAAINVGGVTLHSFFKFPLKPLLPGDDEIPIFKRNAPNRKIIEKTDTIVIDEVSMLRADLMQAIDYSLRHNGGNPHLPFGGKQVLLVGDLFQLPPVVDQKDEVERFIFKEIYKSEYFFDAPAFEELNPVFFEFQKIHRQKDDHHFIKLLNEIRVYESSEETLRQINAQHQPNYSAKQDEFAITLTSNNAIANKENAYKLEALPFVEHVFEATINGDFKTDRYPTHKSLVLKKNAQVILVKNDITTPESPVRRWVNGTIAKVDFISSDIIEIRLQDGTTHKIVPETWENRQYTYDREKGRVMSKVIGTFTQYPVKLAWAITIHKSQGLSFDNVVIDLGRGAFVNGQVYVALSRCRSLQGIHLKNPIRQQDIIPDRRIAQFYLRQPDMPQHYQGIEDFFSRHQDFALQYLSLHYPFTDQQVEKYFNLLSDGSAYYTHFIDREARIVQSKLDIKFNPTIQWTPGLLQKIQMGITDPASGQLKGLHDDTRPPLLLNEELKAWNQSLWALAYSQDYVSESTRDINFGLPPQILDPKGYGKLSVEEIVGMYPKKKLELLTNKSIWLKTIKPLLRQEFVVQLLDNMVQHPKLPIIDVL